MRPYIGFWRKARTDLATAVLALGAHTAVVLLVDVPTTSPIVDLENMPTDDLAPPDPAGSAQSEVTIDLDWSETHPLRDEEKAAVAPRQQEDAKRLRARAPTVARKVEGAGARTAQNEHGPTDRSSPPLSSHPVSSPPETERAGSGGLDDAGDSGAQKNVGTEFAGPGEPLGGGTVESAAFRGRTPPDLSRGARLLETSLTCADLFPLDAVSDGATVAVKIQVSPRGLPAASHILGDRPQWEGFDVAALACARRLRFAPARTPDGTSIGGQAVIQLRFERAS